MGAAAGGAFSLTDDPSADSGREPPFPAGRRRSMFHRSHASSDGTASMSIFGASVPTTVAF
ncbi:MAG: hypothetical protein DMD33_00500 [Gemmatimonadetes bacterium]|nr:MAG: hypothetical protein DMD33_00500 [Gemmatimonadota bacterium]